MRFRYYFLLALKNFFRKKINIVIILFFVISMTMTVLVSSFSKTFSTFINNQVNRNIKHKVLIISEEINDKSKIENISNVDYIIDYSSYGHYVETEEGYTIYLISVPINYIDTIYGKGLENTNDKTMICPSSFYLGNKPEEYNKAFLERLVNGKDVLNKTFILNSNNYREEYSVVGIYDINKYMYGEYNICFTTEENVREIFNKEIESYKKDCNPETHDCDSIGENTSSIVVVDDVTKIEIVQKKLKKMGYRVSKYSEIDTIGIDFITIVLHAISMIIMFIIFIILIVSNNKFINYNKKNNIIYKSLGYENRILIKINYLESIIISIISFMITVLVTLLLYIIFSNIFIADIKTGFILYISYKSLLIVFLLSLVISLLSTFLSLKNNNNSIIKELSDEEL